ncbi:MAG: DUF5011 domain-containing protein [Clostridia bacterium]|nr:DUF5011 domain-containing protein [Clostridia bacterium]
MKKTKFLAIPVLAALLLTGCANTPSEVNKAPSVTGVKDIQCIVNSTVDFLDGVAALDKEDGDITPNMDITVTPYVEVSEDKYAHFTEVGEYTVNYSVKDSKGRVATKRAYVDVVDRETYKTFAMADGFTATAIGGAEIEKSGMIDKKFVLQAKGGEIAEDIKLTRTYTLTTNLQYTFRYMVHSENEGKIKVLADGYDCAEIALKKGENVITFTHTARSSDENEKQKDVTIDICLGSLGEVQWTINKVEFEYPQKAGEPVLQLEDCKFSNAIQRIENGAEGKVSTNADKSSATLEITKTCPDIWLGGMFIDTGITINSGVTYTVSFKVESEQPNDYEIIFQNRQWDETKIRTLSAPNGEVTCDLDINYENCGSLWIYVQSGTNLNKITVSDLKVTGRLNPTATERVNIEDFTEFHADGYNSELKTQSGNFTYDVANFPAVDNQLKVTSPSFLVEGSSANYVVSFKAKASSPVEVVVAAANFYSGWDPTIMWSKVTLAEEEEIYTFFCHAEKDATDSLYNIVWQFGSMANQQYGNVKIEISDIKISMKINGLDG